MQKKKAGDFFLARGNERKEKKAEVGDYFARTFSRVSFKCLIRSSRFPVLSIPKTPELQKSPVAGEAMRGAGVRARREAGHAAGPAWVR